MKKIIFIKKLTIVFCLLFVAVSMLSLMFMLQHEGHECVGAGCTTCLHLNAAQSILKQLATGLAVVSCFFAAAMLVRGLVTAVTNGFVEVNPISLKVKLNN